MANSTENKLLADEIKLAVSEFNRLCSFAATKGIKVDAWLLPLQTTGAVREIPLLEAHIFESL